jgi:hypothetical protein
MAGRLNPYDPPVDAGVTLETPDSTAPAESTENAAIRDFGIAVCFAATVFASMLLVGWIIEVATRLADN